jgi:hypothetical protein
VLSLVFVVGFDDDDGNEVGSDDGDVLGLRCLTSYSREIVSVHTRAQVSSGFI